MLEGRTVIITGELRGLLYCGLRPVLQRHHALLVLLLAFCLGVLGELDLAVIDHEVKLLPAGRIAGQLHGLVVEMGELQVVVALEVDWITGFVALCLEVHGLASVQLHPNYLNEVCASKVERGLTAFALLPSCI